MECGGKGRHGREEESVECRRVRSHAECSGLERSEGVLCAHGGRSTVASRSCISSLAFTMKLSFFWGVASAGGSPSSVCGRAEEASRARSCFCRSRISAPPLASIRTSGKSALSSIVPLGVRFGHYRLGGRATWQVIPTEWGELGKENWCDRVGSQKYRRFLRVLNVSADDFPFFSSLFLFLSLSFRLADRYGAAAPTCVFPRRFRADSLLHYPFLPPSPPLPSISFLPNSLARSTFPLSQRLSAFVHLSVASSGLASGRTSGS